MLTLYQYKEMFENYHVNISSGSSHRLDRIQELYKKNPLILINSEWERNSSFIQLIHGKFCNILLEKDFSAHIQRKAHRKKKTTK